MIFTEGALPGTFIIDAERIEDSRGHFARTFCRREFAEHGLEVTLLQGNTSFNVRKGTLRGLHYQTAPHQEVKIVRCTRGAVYDVAVDARPESPTYGEWMGVELTAENGRMVYIPKGFAHGYLTLADESEVFYHVSAYYTPNAERGIRYNDAAIGIKWPGPVTSVSDKDLHWPDFPIERNGARENSTA